MALVAKRRPPAPSPRPRPAFNFVLTGDARSGAGVVAAAVNAARDAVCHVGLLGDCRVAWEAAHVAYYGAGLDIGWATAGVVGPWQYLRRSVFDKPRRGEHTIGLHLGYADLCRLDLFDLLAEHCREGDFGVVHVQRNPIACLASARQRERFPRPGVRPAVSLDADELTAFCRRHLACRRKVRDACDDALVVRYADLCRRPVATLRGVLDFVEQPPKGGRAPACRATPIARRLLNAAALYKRVPADVRELFDDPDLV